MRKSPLGKEPGKRITMAALLDEAALTLPPAISCWHAKLDLDPAIGLSALRGVVAGHIAARAIEDLELSGINAS